MLCLRREIRNTALLFVTPQHNVECGCSISSWLGAVMSIAKVFVCKHACVWVHVCACVHAYVWPLLLCCQVPPVYHMSLDRLPPGSPDAAASVWHLSFAPGWAAARSAPSASYPPPVGRAREGWCLGGDCGTQAEQSGGGGEPLFTTCPSTPPTNSSPLPPHACTTLPPLPPPPSH